MFLFPCIIYSEAPFPTVKERCLVWVVIHVKTSHSVSTPVTLTTILSMLHIRMGGGGGGGS